MQDNTPTDRVIASVNSYLGLVAALRNRCTELKMTYATLEAIAGLTQGHVGKVLRAEPTQRKERGQTDLSRVRCFGPMSFDSILGALAVKIFIVDDPEQRERVLRHHGYKPIAANAPYSRLGFNMRANGKQSVAHRITHEHLRQISQRGGKARAEKLTPARRREIARKAARKRWDQQRRERADQA